LLPADMLERWPHVCRIKIAVTLLLTNRFVSTTTNSTKCLVNCIPSRIRVRSRNTQPHLSGDHSQLGLVCVAVCVAVCDLNGNHPPLGKMCVAVCVAVDVTLIGKMCVAECVAVDVTLIGKLCVAVCVAVDGTLIGKMCVAVCVAVCVTLIGKMCVAVCVAVDGSVCCSGCDLNSDHPPLRLANLAECFLFSNRSLEVTPSQRERQHHLHVFMCFVLLWGGYD